MADGLGKRIGVFGGTFDPPHHGHLALALEVRHQLDLHTVLMVVANDPWQKSGLSEVTPAADRLDLTRVATDGIDGLEVSAIEIERGGESYSVDTLDALNAECSPAELFLIIGSDVAPGLDTWKQPDKIKKLAVTVVANRRGDAGGRPPAGWPYQVVEVPALEISSSELRCRFGDGRPTEGLMARAVIDTIRRRGLYGATR